MRLDELPRSHRVGLGCGGMKYHSAKRTRTITVAAIFGRFPTRVSVRCSGASAIAINAPHRAVCTVRSTVGATPPAVQSRYAVGNVGSDAVLRARATFRPVLRAARATFRPVRRAVRATFRPALRPPGAGSHAKPASYLAGSHNHPEA